MPLFHYLLIAMMIVFAIGCKKNGRISSNGTTTTPTEWAVYNTHNSSLPDDQVTAIAVDRNNIKWIGTDSGLVRLQNDHWTVFFSHNSPLPSAHVRAVALTQSGIVWVGTDKGLAQYNGTTWQVYTTANSIITSNVVTGIVHDTIHATTWAATEKEIIQINRNGTWKLFDEYSDEIVQSLAVDKTGALWMGTFNHSAFRGHVRKLHQGKWTSYHLDRMGYPSSFPHGLAVDDDNILYTVLGGTLVQAVIRIDNNGWQKINLPICARNINAILAANNRVWVGGTSLTPLGTNLQICVPAAEGSSIQAIAIDRKGKKWLGTVHAGLMYER